MTTDRRDPVIVLFDDEVVEGWQPLVAARPAGELVFGALTARRRAELVFGGTVAGHLARPALAGFAAPHAAPVIALADLPADRPRIFLNARAVPAFGAGVELTAPARLLIGGQVVGCVLPANDATQPAALVGNLPGSGAATAAPVTTGGGRDVEIGGRVLEHVWDLVSALSDQLEADIRALAATGAPPAPALPAGAHVLGSPADLWIDGSASIEPGVVLDTRDGPIRIERDVAVRAFTRLAGPACIGPGTTLLGGRITAVSIGPACKIHGELEETVVLGHSNKAHDGFLGHAYLGEWVNIGALTTNSDLKNNYGPIRIWTPNGSMDTGCTKFGCLLGDHVKTGIGVMLNTGTVIGIGANIFGATQPPKYVPPFSWGTAAELTHYDLDKFLETARTVMRRRDVELDDGMRAVLTRAWQEAGAAGGEERVEAAG